MSAMADQQKWKRLTELKSLNVDEMTLVEIESHCTELETIIEDEDPNLSLEALKLQNCLLKEKDARSKQEKVFLKEEAARSKQEAARSKQEEASCSLGRLREKWIPLIDNTDTSAHSAPKSHEAVNLVEHTVDLAKQEVSEEVWSTRVFAHKPGELIRIHSETDVVIYLVKILEAVIIGLGLASELNVVVQRMVAGIECDIILAYGSNLIPLGAIEVKKPHGEKDDLKIFAKTENKVAGQNLNQLRNLMVMMGLKKCFGMITNGNKFMLTSTHRIDESCRSISTPSQDSPSDTSPERFDVCWNLPVASPCITDMNSLHTSQEFDARTSEHGEDVIKMFVRFVINSYDQIFSMDSTKPMPGTVHARKLVAPQDGSKPTQFVHAFQTIQTAEMNRSNYITPETSNIFLVRYLGGGSCGDCCFAVSQCGKTCCAVKFYVEKLESEELAKNELKNWNSVYCDTELPECRMGFVALTQAYLVMPYLSPVSTVKRMFVLNIGKIKETLEEFSRKQKDGKRYLHRDVKWRHFGYYKEKLYLLDLGRVSEVKGNADAEVQTWIEASLESLTKNMGTAEAGTVDAAGEQQVALKSNHGSPAGAVALRALKRKRHF